MNNLFGADPVPMWVSNEKYGWGKQLDQIVANRHDPQEADSRAEGATPHTTTQHRGWQVWAAGQAFRFSGPGEVTESWGHQGSLRGDLELMETLKNGQEKERGQRVF